MLSDNNRSNQNTIKINDDLIGYANQQGFGDFHVKIDQATGLHAIIAIHNTKLGPALGGCRCREYDSCYAAFEDAFRLAKGMSYKAAVVGLPLGGGKSVLIKPKQIANRQAYFEAFGKFVEEMNGRYITAVDSGTSPEDMDSIAVHTRHVTSKSTENGDPSPYTAIGVKRSIQAAVKFKLDRDSLEGLHIAIQGTGNVGYYLAKELAELGVELTVADVNEASQQRCVDEFGANVVSPDQIYSVDCDLFAPCALGAILNDETIPKIKAKMVVGSSNNQLAEPRHGVMLVERGILYGPDYVVNAGGLVHACAQYYKTPINEVERQVDNIYNTTLAIFERAQQENRSTAEIADTIAEEKLA